MANLTKPVLATGVLAIPCGSLDTFFYLMPSLSPKDIGCLERVCRSWRLFISTTEEIWRYLFAREGIPSVVRGNPQVGDLRRDFQILYPITIGGRIIGEHLGELVEEIPSISEKDFHRLVEVDPFEKEYAERSLVQTFLTYLQKCSGQHQEIPVKNNFICLVNPAKLRRTDRVEFLKPLLENSTVDSTGALVIPLSLKNLTILNQYPLKSQKNNLIFIKESSPAILAQCNTCPDKISVCFMRRRPAEQTKGMVYSEQEGELKRYGFSIVSLRDRTLINVVEMLKSGACFKDSKIYVKTSDKVRIGERELHPIMGSFSPSLGLYVPQDIYESDNYPVVPCIPVKDLSVDNA